MNVLRLLICVMSCGSLLAQGVPKTRILFLLDASYSMNKSWGGGTRWQTAVNTMFELTDSLASMPNVEFALRIYGHQSPMRENNCRDSRLEMGFGNVNAASIRKKLLNIQPNGVTPLAFSMEKCVNDFAMQGDVSRNFLVIVTDGEESCGGNPCSISQLLQRENVILKPIVLGIQLPEVLLDQFGCIGELVNIANSEQLKSELKRVVNESVSKTTFQLNLLDAAGKPTETDVAFTLSDAKTGIPKYHFHHTLNPRGLPDTITVSPLFAYNIKIHTLPQLEVSNVFMKRNEHNIITRAAPQGFLEVKFDGNVPKSPVVEKIKCLVKRPADKNTLVVQAMNSNIKLLTGSYELQLLTLPPIVVGEVLVEQSKTTSVKIPAPGMVTFNKNYELYGGIFIAAQSGLKKIYDFNESSRMETVALQPGRYKLIYRSKFAKTIHTTIEKDIEVTSGGSLSVKL